MQTTGHSLLSGGIGLFAIAALGLTGCSPDEESAEFEDTESASGEDAADSEEQEDESSAADSEDDDADEDQEAGDDSSDSVAQTVEGPIDPDDAVQTVEYSIPTTDLDGTITLGLHHLKVRENTLELLLTFTPEFDQHDTHNLYNLHSNNGAFATPALFDRQNLKRYDPLTGDASQSWSTNVVGLQAHSGETIAYWANFAVPEDDIDTINVGIPSAPEFADVEIDWGDGEPADTEGGEE